MLITSVDQLEEGMEVRFDVNGCEHCGCAKRIVNGAWIVNGMYLFHEDGEQLCCTHNIRTADHDDQELDIAFPHDDLEPAHTNGFDPMGDKAKLDNAVEWLDNIQHGRERVASIIQAVLEDVEPHANYTADVMKHAGASDKKIDSAIFLYHAVWKHAIKHLVEAFEDAGIIEKQ